MLKYLGVMIHEYCKYSSRYLKRWTRERKMDQVKISMRPNLEQTDGNLPENDSNIP